MNSYPVYDNEEEQGLNSALVALGGTAAASSGMIAAEIARRQHQSPTEISFKDAAKQLLNDADSAVRVITGRTPHDFTDSLALNSGSDVNPQRSLRAFAVNETRVNPSSNYSLGASTSGYISNPLTQAAIAARDAFNPSAEDFLSLKRTFRQQQGLSAEGPRTDTVFARIPGLDGLRDVAVDTPLSYSDAERDFRDKNNLSVMRGNLAQKIGSLGGRFGSDFVNNGARSLWWLLNAPQAVVDIASEGTTALTNREGLYGQDLVTYDQALDRNWIDVEGNPLNNSINRATSESADPYYKKRYNALQDSIRMNREDPLIRKNIYSRRRTGNNLSTLLALPAAIGINAGIGLNNPLGGEDGRKAIFASDDDPTKTTNAVAEVGAKYFLGRAGDLLPWDEFKKVRPDVTRDEYMDYKAYRWNKNTDLNPLDDGQMISPLGILKYNNDGINGAEVQFLGKDMPLNTAIMPTLAAMGGAALGTALGRYGALNEYGIQEAIDRRQTMLDELEGRLGTDIDKYSFEDATKHFRWNQELEDREVRKNLVNKVPGLKRIRGRNPVLTGLIGGAGGLALGSLIGNEMERRRREESMDR